ncbi:MAG: histidine phosphatase family protein [Chloroflexi bacterium]|nr:histidine phosphatase family protein [Chloroflexota bacterium]
MSGRRSNLAKLRHKLENASKGLLRFARNDIRGPTIFKIILVRHGQTDWNKEERFRGRFDIELNQTGRAQAVAAGNLLRGHGIAAIYTSPLKRAWETGSIIADATGRPLVTEQDLIDIDFGRFQGLSTTEASAIDPGLMRQWLHHPQQVVFPGGESLPVVEKRAGQVISRVVNDHPDEAIVLVSHSVVCKVIACHITGLDLSHFWQIDQATACISVFERRNNMLVATRINDTCHLR